VIRAVDYPTYNLSRFFYNPAYYLTPDHKESVLVSSLYNQYTGVFNNQRDFAITGMKYSGSTCFGLTIERKEESSVFSKNRLFLNYGKSLSLSSRVDMIAALSLGVYNDYIGENATGLTFSSWVPDAKLGLLFLLDKKYSFGLSSGQLFASEYLGVQEFYSLVRNYQAELWYTDVVSVQDRIRVGARTIIDEISVLQTLSGYYLFKNSYGLGTTWHSDNYLTPELMLTSFEAGGVLMDLRLGYHFRLYAGSTVSIAKNSFMINLSIKGLHDRLKESL
jgi:hypothetical protein